jgi:hypothetical protein
VSTTPIAQKRFPRATISSVDNPMREISTTTARDTPTARLIGHAQTITSAGTITSPPPMPMNPEANPPRSPITGKAAVCRRVT